MLKLSSTMKTVSVVLFVLFVMFVFVCVTKAVDYPEYAPDMGREHWESWTAKEKIFYVAGFGCGVHAMVTKVASDYPEIEEYLNELNEQFLTWDIGVIIGAIDWLYTLEDYKDIPVNIMVVNVEYLVYIERHRLEE